MKTDRHSECCSSEVKEQPATEHHDDGHDHGHGAALNKEQAWWREQAALLTALFILVGLLVLEYGFEVEPEDPWSLLINLTAYLLAGWNVLKLAIRKAGRGDLFNEFVLMSVATLGAFYIGEYSEGVAVMVFYSIGEWFQDSAVRRAKTSIKALLDIRPDQVTALREGRELTINPRKISVGEIIRVKAGEKVALDGTLLSASASFNTAALTGESKPDTKQKGETVLAGMINLNTVSDIEVGSVFSDSKLSRILEMVQDATARKSQTQLFISRFAKVYTPIVFLLALAVVVLPVFFTDDNQFNEWLYRGLVFLVISCPCALVVSIPLGYFGGIGLASRNGILFKGGNFLDVMSSINAVVMDKTGTLTKGVFKVQEVAAVNIDKEELIRLTALLESASTHPVAQAIAAFSQAPADHSALTDVEEIPGHGLRGRIAGRQVIAGNLKLLERYHIPYPEELRTVTETLVVIAVDGEYAGYFSISDEIREDSLQTIQELRTMNIRTLMLSGDKQSVVDKVAGTLGIEEAYGDLLPADKVQKLEMIKSAGHRVAFIGDGVNDAPVIALADAGIAMGGLGSDASIETADIVIQNDQPSKVTAAIRAGRITRNIVWQNITLAMLVKVLVLVLGAGGLATLWEAVIADVGVALLAILNAVRIQRMTL